MVDVAGHTYVPLFLQLHDFEQPFDDPKINHLNGKILLKFVKAFQNFTNTLTPISDIFRHATYLKLKKTERKIWRHSAKHTFVRKCRFQF